MGTHAPPTDDLVVGTITTDTGETYAATVADVDAFFEAMNHGTRRNSFLRASARRCTRNRARKAQRSTRSTTSRRARTSVKSTADPSSSRICLSANPFGTFQGEMQRLPLRAALVGNGGAR